MSGNYTADFNLWIEQTAQLLRSHRWQEVDVEYLIEEVESLGKSEQRGIASQLIRLLLHLAQVANQRARRQAAKQTGMLISMFPEKCPYSLELVLDEDWLPETSDI